MRGHTELRQVACCFVLVLLITIVVAPVALAGETASVGERGSKTESTPYRTKPLTDFAGGRQKPAGSSADWQKSTSLDGFTNGIFALDSTHVWVTGDAGTIWFFDGLAWNKQYNNPSVSRLNAVWAADSKHAWAVGYSGKILFFDGVNWTEQFDGSGDLFYDVEGLSGNDVWASGSSLGQMAHYDGTSWTAVDTPGSYMTALSMRTASDAWSVGGNGDILRYDGSTWSDVTKPAEMDTNTYWGVQAIDQTHVWVSGASEDGPYFYDGTSWTHYDNVCPSTHWRAIDARSASDVWFTTSDAIYKYDGSAFSQVGSGLSSSLKDLCLAADGSAWLINGSGDVYYLEADSPEPPGPTPPGPSCNWYFAEGSTSSGFETFILVQNPNTVSAHVELTYTTPSGAVQGPVTDLSPESRTTFNVGDSVPDQSEVSTVVVSDKTIIAERTMLWGGRSGGHNSVGVTEPSEAWACAEGSTAGGFETWILVQNPNDVSGSVELLFLTPEGPIAGPTETIPPGSRRSFGVGRYVPDAWEVSTFVNASVPVVVERSVYWGGRSAGHNAPGTAYASAGWLLAEGSTAGGFETWILVENPSDETVPVQLLYLTSHGPIEGPSATLQPGSRMTFDVSQHAPDEYDVSTMVATVNMDQYVVAERAVYWNGRRGGHDSLGIFEPAEKWYVAEGSTNGGFETWVLVENPWDESVSVTLECMTPTGKQEGPTIILDAGSRQSFNVGNIVPGEWEVSTTVTASAPVVVEKAIYWSGRIEGGCSNGVQSFATP